ncbi:putative dehydrogenase [Haloactinopolyspora alba]|uniref:Glycosyl hydrolase family 109 protein n=1 Tax=Haloactinopolyspora alba TaxID=648780 RepID=A0A2P8DM41_9ACTN|nr:Gfo/Idh/MocA family oxidoreductase [Haloactinopolyspora alba]PSK98267.1 putative dehydrogenase [Haloactinopolyspora alba]
MSSSQYRPSRRDVIRTGAAIGAAAGVGTAGAEAASAAHREPPRIPGRERSMTDVPFEGFDEVRVGLIGLGNRGGSQDLRWAAVSTVTAVCDVRAERVNRTISRIRDQGLQDVEPVGYSGGDEDFLNLVRRDDIDLIYIATPWEWHYPQAKAAMEHGKHVAVELPIAPHLDEIWDLVRTSERTGKHCMLLENVNYFRPEMQMFNMVHEGLFGELQHASGGYVHDLRWPYFFGYGYSPEYWRRRWQTRMNAAHYPMHGLGPVSAAMGINRGDRFEELVSVSHTPGNLALFREEDPRVGPDHPSWDDDEYISGDRNTCFVTTANGRFIRVEHDTNSPHPYSRETTLTGTRGSIELDNSRVYLESLGHDNHSWRTGSEYDAIRAQRDHWLWPALEDLAGDYGGHGGGDFVAIFRTVQLMRLGMTPDIDVYDSAAWCSVIPLSHESLKTGKLRPVHVPDFTRGYWQDTRPSFDRERPEDPWLDA